MQLESNIKQIQSSAWKHGLALQRCSDICCSSAFCLYSSFSLFCSFITFFQNPGKISAQSQTKPLHVVFIVADDLGICIEYTELIIQGVDDVGYSAVWAERLARSHPETVAVTLSEIPSPLINVTLHINELASQGVQLTSVAFSSSCNF